MLYWIEIIHFDRWSTSIQMRIMYIVHIMHTVKWFNLAGTKFSEFHNEQQFYWDLISLIWNIYCYFQW